MSEIGTDFGVDGIVEDDGAGQTCWRSIGDRYLTRTGRVIFNMVWLAKVLHFIVCLHVCK